MATYQQHYTSHRCCWCNIEINKSTKEHLLPQSVCTILGRDKVRLGLVARACSSCNRKRGNSLGPPPMGHYRPQRGIGWATRAWMDGMAPWIVYPARMPEILSKALPKKLRPDSLRRKPINRVLVAPCLFEMGKYDATFLLAG